MFFSRRGTLLAACLSVALISSTSCTQAQSPAPASDPAPLATKQPAALPVATTPSPSAAGNVPSTQPVQIKASFIRDRMEGAWLAQMAGVAWGAPTEFRSVARIIPDNEVPQWQPNQINGAFWQDDLYVEMPFIKAMLLFGVNCTWTDMGNEFVKTNYQLWHANMGGRDNLQKGIPAPESGHYRNNIHADDIDWQIEADFVGIITPGMIGAAKEIAWRGGHVMNYGDGVYGGVAVAAMHAKAYVTDDLREVIEAGRNSVPKGSTYRAAVDDVIAWHDAGKTWQETWQLIEDKYNKNAHCNTISKELASYGWNDKGANIDAKLNGAYVFMGLIYGDGDLEKTMKIAMQCGQDSDCNPSTAAAILGNMLGRSRLPEKWISGLNFQTSFSNSTYSTNGIIDISMQLARHALILRGGTITGFGADEVWTLPPDVDQDLILEQWPATENKSPELTASFESINPPSDRGANNKVTFTASATDEDGIASYQWFFGDLTFQSGAQITHTYAQSSRYTAICYVTDKVGNTSWKSFVLDVRAPRRR